MIVGISLLLWAATSFPEPWSYAVDVRLAAGDPAAATDLASARASHATPRPSSASA